MKIGYLVEPNAKGQIVIPKKIRDKAGIKPGRPLEITYAGDGLWLKPIIGIVHYKQTDNSAYLDILKQTQGAWGKVALFDQKQRDLELKRSEKIKQTW